MGRRGWPGGGAAPGASDAMAGILARVASAGFDGSAALPLAPFAADRSAGKGVIRG